MKLLPKFALLSFGVAAVPLVIAGLSSARISRQELREAIQEQETLVAANVSNYVARRTSGTCWTSGGCSCGCWSGNPPGPTSPGLSCT